MKSPFNRSRALAASVACLTLSLAAFSAMAQGSPSPSVAAKQADLAQLKATLKSGAALNPSALGSLGADMVYTPVNPCRIVDTRNAVGAFAANTARNYDLDGLGSTEATTYAQQGGIAASCNIPHGVVFAAALNLTVTGTTGTGFLTAWGLGTQPNASVLNWAAGNTLANTTIVPIVPGTSNDFSIFASSGTHVIIDVVGYFAAPTVTLPDTQFVEQFTDIVAPGANAVVTLTCPAGYIVMSGSMADQARDDVRGVATNVRYMNATQMRLGVSNGTTINRSFIANMQCLRIPGR
jgi:hypothetical protein